MKRMLLLLFFLNSVPFFCQHLTNDKCKDIKEKEIVDILVFDENYNKELEESYFGDKINVLVQTCNYKAGEEITITYQQDESDNEYKLTGIIGEDGNARIENIIFEKNNNCDD